MVKTIPPGAALAPLTIPDELIDTLRAARSVVFFTGAGDSSESGIPTFRDALTGLWERFDAEALATPEAFVNDPALVWGWYEWRRRQVEHAQPHPGHQAMAALEESLPAVTVITQNVDDLHERAGSRRVIHLHGSLFAPRVSIAVNPTHSRRSRSLRSGTAAACRRRGVRPVTARLGPGSCGSVNRCPSGRGRPRRRSAGPPICSW